MNGPQRSVHCAVHSIFHLYLYLFPLLDEGMVLKVLLLVQVVPGLQVVSDLLHVESEQTALDSH